MFFTKNLLNIPKLLRGSNGGRSQPAKLDVDKPLPSPPHNEVKPSQASNCRGLALELGNYTNEYYPLARYDVKMDQIMKCNAFKAALRNTTDELDLGNFAFKLDPNNNNFNSEQATLVDTDRVDSDLNTLVEPGCTSNDVKPVDTVHMMSLEDIVSNKHEIIPALLMQHTDVIDSTRLAYNHETMIYYDDLVDHIHNLVQSRGVYSVPQEPDHKYFRQHAVRTFLEIPDVPDITGGPFYRPLGDYYIIKTHERLPARKWSALSDYKKSIFVDRFVQMHNASPTDGHRTQNDYTSKSASQLLDMGSIFPLIVLKPAYQKEDSMSPVSPIMLDGLEPLIFNTTSYDSTDSASTYSQESAADDDSNEEDSAPFYASAANLAMDTRLSPLFTDPFAGNVIITFPTGEQEIYAASEAAFSYNVEDYEGCDDTNKSIWSDNGDNDEACDNYDGSDFGNESDSEHRCGNNVLGLEEHSEGSDDSDDENSIREYGEETSMDDSLTDLDAIHDSPSSSVVAFLHEKDQMRYYKLKADIKEAALTANSYTPLGKVQLEFMMSLVQEKAALVRSAIALSRANII